MFVNPIDLKMNEPTQCDRYKQILVSIMSYKDNVDYAVTYEFSTEQLGTLVPEDIYNWVPTRCFRSDPGPNDNPTFCRSSSRIRSAMWLLYHRVMTTITSANKSRNIFQRCLLLYKFIVPQNNTKHLKYHCSHEEIDIIGINWPVHTRIHFILHCAEKEIFRRISCWMVWK